MRKDWRYIGKPEPPNPSTVRTWKFCIWFMAGFLTLAILLAFAEGVLSLKDATLYAAAPLGIGVAGSYLAAHPIRM